MYQHEMKHLTQKWIDFKDSFTIATDKIHENSISVQVQSVIFISIFFYLYHIHWKISSLFCVSFCAVHLKREIHAVRLKKWKIYRKSTESRIIDVPPPSDQSDREHGNPLKPDRTRDDVSKKINTIDARFQRIFPTQSGRYPSISSIFGESADGASWPKPWA